MLLLEKKVSIILFIIINILIIGISPEIKNNVINNYNPLKNNSKKLNTTNNINTFQKALNIGAMNPMHKNKKAQSPYMFNPFTAEGVNHNKRNKVNNFPVKVVGQKSNSLDKVNNKNKIWKNNNYSKYYCITLNQYAQIKKEHLSLNSLNSQSSSNSKNKTNRPSTAPQRDKNHKNKNRNDKKTDFMGFNGITNIRTNLMSSGNHNGLDKNKKYKIKENNINGFNTVFKPYNTFTNNILNHNNGFNNKYAQNNAGYNNKVLFGANNKRITSPRIVGKPTGHKNKRQNNGEKMRLASPNINNNIAFINNINSQKYKK